MNYTLNQLQVFQKVVQLRSMTKASESLHLTQPAVSIQLKNFQLQFEMPLFEVIGRKVYITDFGHEIATAVDEILFQVSEIHFKSKSFQGDLAGKLKIASVSTGKYVMPYFLTDFIKMHSGVELSMDVTNRENVLSRLEKNEVDFALVSVLPRKLKVERIELLSNELYLIGNKHVQQDAFKSKKELQEHSLIYRELGSSTRLSMEDFIDKRNLDGIKKIELTSNEAVKQAVIAGLGISIMPKIGLRNELKSGDLKIIDIKGLPIVTQWNLIWLRGKKLTQVAKSYLEYLEENRLKITKTYF
jgi:DNA-binding transcriptional LysR family regulator